MKPLFVLGGVILSGFILAQLTPMIRVVVEGTFGNVQGQGILLDFLLIGFIPFMWFFFIIASVFFLMLSLRGDDSAI